MDYLWCTKSQANFLCTSSAFYPFQNVLHVLEASLNNDWMTTAKEQQNSLIQNNRSLCPKKELSCTPVSAPPISGSVNRASMDAAWQPCRLLPVWWCCLLPAGRWPEECFHGTLGHWMRSWWGRWPGWRPPPCQGGTEPQPGSSHPCSWGWIRNLPLERRNTALINLTQSS